ncbi:MAG: transposase, partial [Gammaproteobacteria bacterium]|nr:transposase [Gammaproteobacteria bacterium]
ANDIYRFAATMLQPHLKWLDHGPKCTVTVLLQVLFYAAAQLCSVFAACSRLKTAPSDQAVRDALVALCPEAGVLQMQFNQSFAAQLPKGLKKRSQRLAIDLTLIPYHGQPHRCSEEIYRSQAKSGTTHFHAYATCYVVHKGRRFTVAMMRVNQGTTMVEVLKCLIHQAIRAGIRPSLLLLDRGFYSVKVIRYLQAARYGFIMPVIIRGRNANDPRGPSATRVFAVQKHSGWAKYTLMNSEKIKATVRICIHCRNWAGRRKRHGRQTLVYAVWGLRPKTTHWVYQIYRLRFGIETSYRQLHEARIKTTTRNPQLRLLFIGIALLLRNLWVWVHWHYLASPRRGGRKLNLFKLRFKTLLMWLTHFAENTFGIDDAVLAERSPQ